VNVCVLGLWHLGTVTAACLAQAGHEVTGLDFDASVIDGLSAGRPPVFEPGLEDLVKAGLAAGRLRFTTDVAQAVKGADVVWVAYDTPVDDEDRADVEGVRGRVLRVFPTSRTARSCSSLPVAGEATARERAFANGADGRVVDTPARRRICASARPRGLCIRTASSSESG
jgi:UDPglucose 6-dehydrogenase